MICSLNDYQNLDIYDFRNEQIIVQELFFLAKYIIDLIELIVISWRETFKCHQNLNDLLPLNLGIHVKFSR